MLWLFPLQLPLQRRHSATCVLIHLDSKGLLLDRGVFLLGLIIFCVCIHLKNEHNVSDVLKKSRILSYYYTNLFDNIHFL